MYALHSVARRLSHRPIAPFVTWRMMGGFELSHQLKIHQCHRRIAMDALSAHLVEKPFSVEPGSSTLVL